MKISRTGKLFIKINRLVKEFNLWFYGPEFEPIYPQVNRMNGRHHDKALSEHFLNLVNMAMSDGSIHPKEFEFLVEVGIECGFNKSELDFLLSNAKETEFVEPTNTLYATKLLTDLVRMARADGSIDSEEFERLKVHAEVLRLSEETLVQIIKGVKLKEELSNHLPE